MVKLGGQVSGKLFGIQLAHLFLYIFVLGPLGAIVPKIKNNFDSFWNLVTHNE
jgi:ABC-type sulfate transport system permease component